MINLNDHVVIRQDKEYVPLEIAQAAVAEAYNEHFEKLNTLLKKSMEDYNKGIADILNDD